MSTDILSYIPQRPPFIMIGEVLSTDEKYTYTTLRIEQDNIFVSNGFFTEPGLVENMAQTAGAGTGYKALRDGKPMPSGYIAALRNVNILELPKVNDTIKTETIFLQTVMGFHLVKGTVTCDGKEMANCEFKIFVPSDAATPQ